MVENILQSYYKKNLSSVSLVLMMILLHSALWFDFGSPLSKSLFLAHFGFFLLWQPIWNRYKHLTLLNGILFISFTSIFVYWLNLWSILLWMFLLVGFIGGILKFDKSERNIYMISLMFIVTELLIGCNTQLFEISLDPTVDKVFTLGMFYIPLLIFFFPGQPRKESLSVDLLRAISISLLISLLTLGSLLSMYHSGSDYLLALIQTILAISLCLVLISWLLSPRLGFSGFSQLWSQSLLNIGTPFETWLNQLYLINQEIDSPDEFLEYAMRELVSVSWVTGIEWNNTNNKGNYYAEKGKHQIKVNINELAVTIHTRLLAGGALYLHSRLLIQLIENMYTAKIHEHKLAQQAHLKTVHETGARVTHDIKNLLQSLKTLGSIATKSSTKRRDTDKLLETQLPNLTLRLQLALDKLNAPELIQHEYETLTNWCDSLKNRMNNKSVTLDLTIETDPEVPADLFDSIVDNLLENAYIKQQLDNDIKISVIVISNENEISLCVKDSGKAIPDSIAKIIFTEILPSSNGLGIGLYQAAKQAELNGYRLKLENNEDGDVCFKLTAQ